MLCSLARKHDGMLSLLYVVVAMLSISDDCMNCNCLDKTSMHVSTSMMNVGA